MIALRLGFLMLALVPGTDEPQLVADDLDAYERALGVADEDGSPTPATFRDLWDKPETYRGKRVKVEGRVVRRFHQGKSARFPSLVEVWLTTPTKDPICVVIPDSEAAPKLGETRSFVGTYLKRVTYEAGDAPRLAPLVVGPGPGQLVSAAVSSTDAARPVWSLSTTEWTLSALLAAGVMVFLLRQHLQTPASLRRERPEPDPIFEDGEPGEGRTRDDS